MRELGSAKATFHSTLCIVTRRYAPYLLLMSRNVGMNMNGIDVTAKNMWEQQMCLNLFAQEATGSIGWRSKRCQCSVVFARVTPDRQTLSNSEHVCFFHLSVCHPYLTYCSTRTHMRIKGRMWNGLCLRHHPVHSSKLTIIRALRMEQRARPI
jgi:hypothetical protein